jgi:hypothetical protein
MFYIYLKRADIYFYQNIRNRSDIYKFCDTHNLKQQPVLKPLIFIEKTHSLQ